jgi:hypothetical protein
VAQTAVKDGLLDLVGTLEGMAKTLLASTQELKTLLARRLEWPGAPGAELNNADAVAVANQLRTLRALAAESDGAGADGWDGGGRAPEQPRAKPGLAFVPPALEKAASGRPRACQRQPRQRQRTRPQRSRQQVRQRSRPQRSRQQRRDCAS